VEVKVAQSLTLEHEEHIHLVRRAAHTVYGSSTELLEVSLKQAADDLIERLAETGKLPVARRDVLTSEIRDFVLKMDEQHKIQVGCHFSLSSDHIDAAYRLSSHHRPALHGFDRRKNVWISRWKRL
jgi:hypothetical protein